VAKKLAKPVGNEPDAVYFLKLLLYFLLGLMWISYRGHVIFPAGLVVGIVFASQDHFRIDRKVEYAVLLISCLLGLVGYGIIISLGS
jgi:hypothetical protein